VLGAWLSLTTCSKQQEIMSAYLWGSRCSFVNSCWTWRLVGFSVHSYSVVQRVVVAWFSRQLTQTVSLWIFKSPKILLRKIPRLNKNSQATENIRKIDSQNLNRKQRRLTRINSILHANQHIKLSTKSTKWARRPGTGSKLQWMTSYTNTVIWDIYL